MIVRIGAARHVYAVVRLYTLERLAMDPHEEMLGFVNLVDLGPFTACNWVSPYVIKVSAMAPPATSARVLRPRVCQSKQKGFPAAGTGSAELRSREPKE